MKLIKIASVLTIITLSQAALALDCSNAKGSLKVDKYISRLFDKIITLESSDQKAVYYGQTSQESQGSLYGKTVIELKDYSTDGSVLGTLEIFTSPKHCGRGSCDVLSDTLTTAELVIGENKEYFHCENLF